MKASPPTQAAVQATLQQWKDAYSQRDLDGALAVIAPDEDVVGIGTGPDEWRVGPEAFRAQLERDFAQSEALSVNYEPLVVSEAGPVAWVAGRGDRPGAGRGPGADPDRSVHRRPGAARRPLAAGADPLLAPGRRTGRGPILLSSARPQIEAVSPLLPAAPGAAGDLDRTDNHGYQRTAVSKVGRAAQVARLPQLRLQRRSHSWAAAPPSRACPQDGYHQGRALPYGQGGVSGATGTGDRPRRPCH